MVSVEAGHTSAKPKKTSFLQKKAFPTTVSCRHDQKALEAKMKVRRPQMLRLSVAAVSRVFRLRSIAAATGGVPQCKHHGRRLRRRRQPSWPYRCTVF